MNGLTAHRQRQLEEKQRRLAELAELRKQATSEERDGRVFRVIRVPDRYGMRAPLNVEGWKKGQAE